MVASSVRCRATAVRAPPVSRRNRSCNRASICAGDRTTTRAAANSIARGMPSSRRQMRAIASALSRVGLKVGSTPLARSTKSCVASASRRASARTGAAAPGIDSEGTRQMVSPGHVYTFGATGILNALDARTGAVVWSRNAATDTGTKTPDWGFASSPLVVDDLVVVNVSGALVAYDLATGTPRWSGPVGGEGYSSPRLVTIGGITQILAVNGAGAIGAAAADGSLLWQHQWRGYPIVQPALVENGDVLLSVGESSGVRRIAVLHESGGCNVEERWTSTALKPYFNDFVVHDGHVFGFDGGILACISLADGKRAWKGGRRACAGRSKRQPVQRGRSLRRARGQDLESSRAGRRHPARSQRPRDGGIPLVHCEPLTGAASSLVPQAERRAWRRLSTRKVW